MGTGAGSVSLSQFPPTDSKKGGLGSTSTRQTPHLPAPLSYKGLTQASIGFRFILFPFPVCFGIEKKISPRGSSQRGQVEPDCRGGGRASGLGGAGAEHRGQAEPPAQDFCFSKVGRERGTDIGHAEREGARWVGAFRLLQS